MNNADKAIAIAEEEKKRRIEDYKLRSKKALERLVKSRCTTIFIGALDSIEKKLGDQWGSDKPLHELDREEKLFLQIWKDLRKEILDKSNHQVKLLLRETGCFDVVLRPNHYDIHFIEGE